VKKGKKNRFLKRYARCANSSKKIIRSLEKHGLSKQQFACNSVSPVNSVIMSGLTGASKRKQVVEIVMALLIHINRLRMQGKLS